MRHEFSKSKSINIFMSPLHLTGRLFLGTPHHPVTSLPLLLPILVPMCAKSSSTCLQVSSNKRCNLQAPWTSIYLLLFLLLRPHGCQSHFPHLSSGRRDQQEGRSPTHGCCRCAAGRCPRRSSTASTPGSSRLRYHSLHPSSAEKGCNILTKLEIQYRNSFLVGICLGFFPTPPPPRCCVLTQGHKHEIASSNVHCSGLYIGKSLPFAVALHIREVQQIHMLSGWCKILAGAEIKPKPGPQWTAPSGTHCWLWEVGTVNKWNGEYYIPGISQQLQGHLEVKEKPDRC